jgi:proline iminopeptidase
VFDPSAVAAATVDAVVAATPLSTETVVFGHSMNGALALAVAAVKPCRGVIAVAPPCGMPIDLEMLQANWDAHAEPDRKALASAIRAEYDAADDERKAALVQQYASLRSWYDFGEEHPSLGADSAELSAWVQDVMASGVDVDWPATFDAVSVPVFVALGRYDFLAPPTPWLEAPVADRWTIELFERSGHSPFVEQPDAFVAALDRWLTTI